MREFLSEKRHLNIRVSFLVLTYSDRFLNELSKYFKESLTVENEKRYTVKQGGTTNETLIQSGGGTRPFDARQPAILHWC